MNNSRQDSLTWKIIRNNTNAWEKGESSLRRTNLKDKRRNPRERQKALVNPHWKRLRRWVWHEWQRFSSPSNPYITEVHWMAQRVPSEVDIWVWEVSELRAVGNRGWLPLEAHRVSSAVSKEKVRLPVFGHELAKPPSYDPVSLSLLYPFHQEDRRYQCFGEVW